MASNMGGAPAESREERVKSAGKKLLMRMKTVLRKTDSSKRTSTVPTTAAVVSPAPVAGPSTTPANPPAPSEPAEVPESAPAQLDDAQAIFEGERIPRAQIYSERAQQLAERFGLDMDPHTWYQMDGHVLRVNRPIHCPRDPPKKDKYPYGYPGDEFGAKSIPYYKCHECYAKFPPGAKDGDTCPGCSHKKCNNCERLRPQKVEPAPDPEVMRSVQAKMAETRLS
ncbi:hypothetical protein KVR01_003237 [Diaporthe batatas]|uniref:uncharacterized protein n=1 Tax=Diaporthe batatas TaxID=748121 RepID=UPI001D05C18A|nr:uncharacterized protein KVR01_003237 [Diaporthe batatas]KAG8167548.1 hypothetical protein KVR01_003237 [Diaporthe batatas]